jgi:hypothetical protein
MRMTAGAKLVTWINDRAGRDANVGAARNMRETT